ncbi:hypothetical protein CVT24_000803 [Panaeolus cyanescens]|uniref:Uncharacterized protein n=1 Tax=Panaeolus cyanescens TaxID=181874 RepID=A0A409WPK0_9AGAR|nr:hypothetical protein CVT24_000803 [Panaeolus cyanescens]
MSNKTRVAYMKQSFNGIPVSNAVANIVFDGADRAFLYASSFVNATKIADPNPTFSWRCVLPDLEKNLESTLLDEKEATLEYLARDDGSVALAHVIQLRNETLGTWYEVFIDGHSGEVLSINNFVAHAAPRRLRNVDWVKALTASPSGTTGPSQPVVKKVVPSSETTSIPTNMRLFVLRT